MQGGSGQIARAVQKNFGLPDTFKTVSPFPFAGINQQASRLAIGDPKAWWLENLVKIGDGNMRAVPDIGAAIYKKAAVDTRKIISFSWYSIGLINYCIIFFDNGSAIQVSPDTGPTVIPAGSFYVAGGSYPATVSWGGIYLLISNNNTPNDYWVWDGAVKYSAGGAGPIVTLTSAGQSYVVAPSITVFGGHGSGVVLEPTISNGSVTSLKVTNPGSGYVPGDFVQVLFNGGGSDDSAQLTAVLQTRSVNQTIMLAGGSGYTSAPAVVFTGGGGVGATATATVFGGSVIGVLMTAGGTGYTSAPSVSFTGGGGTGAQAQATLVSAGVASVSVDSGGSNYFGVPALTLQGGLGSGATATAVMSGPAKLFSIKVTNGGSGYTSLPTVGITDGGAGAGATAIVTGAIGGSITEITLTAEGADYDSPVVAITGGGGSGATATAAVGGGSIASVTVDTAGGGYTSAPAVLVEAGLNNAAAATLELMPFGVSGDSIETYQSQVWLQNPYQIPGAPPVGGVRLSSAPGSISDFATSSGGLAETVTDRFLRRHLTAIRQANGFLYPFGDSSVGLVANVQVDGSPPTKKLTTQNTDPQTGTHWRDTLQDFSRTILFANEFGVFGLFGGAVTKISGEVDGIFESAQFPTSENPSTTGVVTPSAAVANLYNRKLYLLLLRVRDPITLEYSNKMLAWNEQDWSVISQSVEMSFIGTQEINSNLVAWGTDGIGVYPMMQTPSTGISKVWLTKLWGAQDPFLTKVARTLYVQAQNIGDPTRAPAFNVTIETEFARFPVAGHPSIAFPPAIAQLPSYAERAVIECPLLMLPTNDIAGQQLGIAITSTDADFSVYNLMLAHEIESAIFG